LPSIPHNPAFTYSAANRNPVTTMTKSHTTNGHNGAKTQPSFTLTSSNGSAPDQPKANGSGTNQATRTETFDQPVVLQQTSVWSRAIVWGIVSVTTFVVIWASVAKIEEAVPATGKLEPQGSVQEVEVPVGGVVEEVLVEDGQRVEKGELLVRLDPTAAEAQRRSLQQVRNSLAQEVRFYRAQLSGATQASPDEGVDLPAEILSLNENRAALIAENNLYRAQLRGTSAGANLNPEQQERLQAIAAEADSRTAAAQLQLLQSQREYNQVDIQLAAAQESLAIDQEILGDIAPLVEEGAIGRLQRTRQEQEVLNARAEVSRLTQEKARLELAIAEAQQQLQNTVAVSSTDLLSRIADNDKQIAAIDSELNKAIVENEKQIADIDSQLSQTELNLRYQELRAPVDGVVFDLQTQNQGVVNQGAPEPILRIVPDDSLIARVAITNQDIGFVGENQEVDVRIDSFPYSEFGDIKGELIWIGSDALPPTEITPFYTFPAKIRLEEQTLNVGGRDIELQSGMSVTVNIKVRQRTVMSIFTELFKNKVDSLRTVR
jgi:HlyD family secretion protein